MVYEHHSLIILVGFNTEFQAHRTWGLQDFMYITGVRRQIPYSNTVLISRTIVSLPL